MQLNSLNYCTRVEDISAPRGHSDMPGSVVSIISINRIRIGRFAILSTTDNFPFIDFTIP